MKWRMTGVLCLILSVALGGVVFAQTHLTVTGIKYDAGVPELSAIDKDHWVAIADLKGIKIDTTTGKGPLNNMASDTKLVLFGDKSGVHFHGYITLMDKEGDKMVWEIWDNPAAGPNKSAGKLVAATGKFEGMEGTMDAETEGLNGFPGGTWQNVGKCVEKLILKTPL
jgi:hypothetical protein